MPELPEVEHFRQTLLPLVSTDRTQTLSLHRLNDDPLPRKWLSMDDMEAISNHCYCTNVLRKGKLLCMVLEMASADENDAAKDKETTSESTTTSVNAPIIKYLFLHMGMTGRVTAPGRITVLENVKDDGSVFPPPFTYLMLQTNEDYPVAFCDPRKFSACQLCDSMQLFDELAPDAVDCNIDHVAARLCHQTVGIKTLLLDQKRVVSGVGNWVADEVLYQLQLHPNQTQLGEHQARELLLKLQEILKVAIDCLNENKQYPSTWLFNHRWTKKKSGNDHHGRPLTFLKSGGRTSAIVASMQKLIATKKVVTKEASVVTDAAAVGRKKKRVVAAAIVNSNDVEDKLSAPAGRVTRRRRTHQPN
ncbi:hypothetical protein MPSEU_000682300 [Mayamaea pseudoterrestris]|nr:hypothetical protein MPSEU_000682300 [Mayamaea pseudoterrestris]